MECLKQTEPLLISDGLKNWPASQRWTPEFLATTVGESKVDVFVSSNGAFVYQPDGIVADPSRQSILRDIAFRQASERILDANLASLKYYISQQDIAARLPERFPDPRFRPYSTNTHRNLWFGSAGTVM